MVELRMKKRELRADGGYHHGNVGLEQTLCANHVTIPDKAGTSHDLGCNNTNTRSSQPNLRSYSPDFSYPVVFSTSFSSSSPISLFLIHNSTVIAEHKVKSSLTISPCHDHQFTLCTASTKYSIHPRVFVFPSFSWLQRDPQMYLQLPACFHTWLTTVGQLSMRAQR